jgi:hypothetical protein
VRAHQSPRDREGGAAGEAAGELDGRGEVAEQDREQRRPDDEGEEERDQHQQGRREGGPLLLQGHHHEGPGDDEHDRAQHDREHEAEAPAEIRPGEGGVRLPGAGDLRAPAGDVVDVHERRAAVDPQHEGGEGHHQGEGHGGDDDEQGEVLVDPGPDVGEAVAPVPALSGPHRSAASAPGHGAGEPAPAALVEEGHEPEREPGLEAEGQQDPPRVLHRLHRGVDGRRLGGRRGCRHLRARPSAIFCFIRRMNRSARSGA